MHLLNNEVGIILKLNGEFCIMKKLSYTDFALISELFILKTMLPTIIKISATLVVLMLAAVFPATAQQKKKPLDSKEQSLPHPTTPRQTPPMKANYGKYEFTYTTLDGKTIKLSDHAGKVVLVNIWAPWCGPCRYETPGFVKLYQEYKDKGFEILGVAVNTNQNDVKAFLQKYSVSWPNGISDEVGRQYGVYGIPENNLFGPDGSLIKKFVGYTREEQLRPLIDAALKTRPKTGTN
jgi:thiol-disulfide isomerase/thioredoxin